MGVVASKILVIVMSSRQSSRVANTFVCIISHITSIPIAPENEHEHENYGLTVHVPTADGPGLLGTQVLGDVLLSGVGSAEGLTLLLVVDGVHTSDGLPHDANLRGGAGRQEVREGEKRGGEGGTSAAVRGSGAVADKLLGDDSRYGACKEINDRIRRSLNEVAYLGELVSGTGGHLGNPELLELLLEVVELVKELLLALRAEFVRANLGCKVRNGGECGEKR